MSTNETSPPAHRTLRQVAGVCGLLCVIIASSSVALAIFYSPGNFSFTQNWLSDLGGTSYAGFNAASRDIVSSPTTELIFNSGLVVGGVFTVIFSFGLLSDAHSRAFRRGAVCMIIGAVWFIAIGLVPEPLGIMHDIVTILCAIFCAAAACLCGGSLIASSEKPLGFFSIALGIIALIGISLYLYFRATAEMVFVTAISLWIVIFSIRMLRRGLQQK